MDQLKGFLRHYGYDSFFMYRSDVPEADFDKYMSMNKYWRKKKGVRCPGQIFFIGHIAPNSTRTGYVVTLAGNGQPSQTFGFGEIEDAQNFLMDSNHPGVLLDDEAE